MAVLNVQHEYMRGWNTAPNGYSFRSYPIIEADVEWKDDEWEWRIHVERGGPDTLNAQGRRATLFEAQEATMRTIIDYVLPAWNGSDETGPNSAENEAVCAAHNSPDTLTRDEFEEDLRCLINRHSIENVADMPDFLLADMICRMVAEIGTSIKRTLEWYGLNSTTPQQEVGPDSAVNASDSDAWEQARAVCASCKANGTLTCDECGVDASARYGQ